MSWRGESGGIEAAKQNHDVIMTPTTYVYFDYSQTKKEDSVTIGGFIPLEKVYNYEPVPKELSAEQAKHILGAQANVWSEYMAYPSKVEYMIFPRLTALSEVLWSPKEKKDWKSFEQRLQTQFERYKLWGASSSNEINNMKAAIMPAENNDGVYWSIQTPKGPSTGVRISFGKDSNVTYEKPVHVNKTTTLTATPVGEKREGAALQQKFFINKATGKKISLSNAASEKYPGNGAFTLVNGAIAEKGLGDAESFLGFEGNDMEVLIDLGSVQKINSVTVYSLTQINSWIYPPKYIDAQLSKDGQTFPERPKAFQPVEPKENRYTTLSFDEPVETRYVKVQAKNYGVIPEGNPGAGNKSWLFVDEIQIN
jgi:hexosaminidase